MSALRIFSYLPNPRLWKATIAARLCDVELDIRGAKPPELANWLWDFDARPLDNEEREAHAGLARRARTGFDGALLKTDAFLAANPFGTVPVAFSPDGATGIFESNAIMRAVARLGAERYPLYGDGPYAAARVESFLDVSLVFARESQRYLLAIAGNRLTPALREEAGAALATWLAGMEQALQPSRQHLVGEGITLADICFVAELTQFARERGSLAKQGRPGEALFDDAVCEAYPLAMAHYARLSDHEAFAPDVKPFQDRIEAAVRAAVTEGGRES